MQNSVQIEIIGIVRSCYPEKFGIPRQPGLVKSSAGRLELCPGYDREEMVRGLEGFSHLWIQFLFHEAVEEGWRPTVRPPWLGGQKRVGVFASRSPHRPNFMGMSVVRLRGISVVDGRLGLNLAELDLLDGTPVLDFKPYLPYSDSLPEATSGFVRSDEAPQRLVEFTARAQQFCADYEQRTARPLATLIRETLAQDPRPASQRHHSRSYGMTLWDVNIRWQVGADEVFVVDEISGDHVRPPL
ncbi:MAG: tRNA (N6-threonylcarbamoyladenosine(37)-N6)-methyltransferase TrmO [Desulfobulbaceae bacterium]|uniref:tRNA (N6-threonylcarbamoyladenosine(37)-N6)-methyltransferase TrmO n=1 Tax=Candidatus Desulfatifera sulfidica TaxID=2841691 RepID=A0A8J6NB19_9BACT|nr:tRNA (N6-threonylcarbamoyladenosine(37)-N6)-methyltransferase TrmO [Candidatus Desulfatifera sulfidica]